jgi:uncharacterized RDD family membrane protein YckC
METTELTIAKNRHRLLAYLIDTIPIVLVLVLFSYNFLGFDEVYERYTNRGDDVEPRKEFIKHRNLIREFAFLVWIVYCMFMEASVHQGTFGKKIMGIKVVDENGNKMTLQHSVQRNISKMLSYFVVLLGFIWIMIDKNKQGWHDKMSRTFVVKR